MLTNAQRANIRRYCGYSMFGASSDQLYGARYFTQYGVLEFRMTNAQPEEFDIFTEMLTVLDALRVALYGSTDNLDTSSAGPWVHNAKEVGDRTGLYHYHRRELANFVGVPAGPYFPGNGSQRVL